MKKITILMLFLSTIWGYSQVNRYTFAKSTGIYTEISGGTVLGNESSDNQLYVNPSAPLGGSSALSGSGFPIGFNFTFNGYVYDSFAVATDGYISLGSSAFAPNSVNIKVTALFNPLTSVDPSTTDVLAAKIAALAHDLMAQSGSSISYKTIGNAPNRTLVVQWKKYKKGTGFGTGDNFNFQIRLNETTNKVDIVYGSMVSNASETPMNFQVGLRAEPAAVATNFANRKSASGWDNTIAGTAASDTVLMSDFFWPSNGLTYTWTPPTCGGANALVVSSILGNGVTLNWGAYTPIPESYEYVVSTSSAMPLSTDSGTATTNPTAAVTNLNSNAVYNVFLRSKCGSTFTPWVFGGTFKTTCFEAPYLYEDFDSYTANGSILPECWTNTGTTGTCFIQAGAASISAPNCLYMFANASSSGKTVAYAIMPPLSNLQAGTNSLRFKAYSSPAGGIDIGYINGAGTFMLLETKTLPGTTVDKTQDFIYTPAAGVIPSGVKNLVFRNTGTATSFVGARIDNVVWEPTPNCPDVTAVTGKAFTSTSIDLSWAKGGSETQWQYGYGPATIQNPGLVTPVDVSSNAITVNGLNPGTKYKIWVRSKCSDTALGSWRGPLIFTTPCSSVSQFMEDFDTSLNMPSCWAKVGTTGTVSAAIGTTAAPFAPSGPNVLQLNSTSTTNIAIVTLPPVSNAGAGTNRLRFKMRGDVAGAQMDIGYLTDVSDPSTFKLLESVTSTTTYDNYTKFYGADPKTPYLAFRNPGVVSSTIFLDDVAWEPNPACPDISGISATAVTGTSANLTWTAAGSENGWQYAIGASTLASPYSLTAVDVASSSTPLSLAITGLAPVTSYKVWMRSKCVGNTVGAWIGPVSFTTTCTSVTDFSENFDVSTAMPACWRQVGIGGTINVTINGNSSSPNGLQLSNGTAPIVPVICAMPPVSNAAAGTHRLKFKFKSSAVDGLLEIGYLLIPSDPSSFIFLKSVKATQTTSFEQEMVELGTDALTDVLAFRNAGVPSATMYVDDVIWEPIPVCPDIKNLAATGATGTTADIAWNAGGFETNWQYAIGSISLSDPGTLTPVDVATTSAVTISALNPVSSYKVWVRAKCTSILFGPWSNSITITTACDAVDSFKQNFDASLDMPSCWNKLGLGASFPFALGGAPSGANVLSMYSGNPSKQSIVSMPPISNAASGDHVLKFKYKSSVAGCILEVGYLATPWDATSFSPFKTITVDSTTDFKSMVLSLGNSPVSNLLAFRNNGFVGGNIYLDDVSWEAAPVSAPACVSGTTAVTNANCGNFGTVISWPGVAGADGYKLTVGTTSGGFDVVNGLDVNLLLTYTLAANAKTTYYYTVVPYNSFGSAAGCAEKTYVTSPNTCYCTSYPITHDGPGILSAKFGATDFADGSKGYHDYTSKPVTVAKGANANLQITFDTNGKPYNVAVYVDLNDNYNFEASEIFFTGLSGTAAPNTVDASFMMPATANLGNHRIRVCSVEKSLTIDPCYNGTQGLTADFAVNVIDAALDVNTFDDINFSYYPNPVKDILNLSFNQEMGNVSVVNLLGQQVISKSLNANQGKIDMSGLARGAYLVKVTVGNQSKTIKVIKE